MSDDIRVLEGKEMPATVYFLPCHRCEMKVRTAAFGIRGQDFGTTGTARLCSNCLQALTKALAEPQQEEQR